MYVYISIRIKGGGVKRRGGGKKERNNTYIHIYFLKRNIFCKTNYGLGLRAM